MLRPSRSIRTAPSTGRGVIGQEQVANLPINGRNWAGLMILVPGAINTGSGNQTSIRFAGSWSWDDNKILFERGRCNRYLAPIREIGPCAYSWLPNRFASSVSTLHCIRRNTAARAGGTGVTSSQRRGQNEFHGSVYEFLRNDVLNARALFSTTQLPLRLNQYGASLGGPIARNHTFFFLEL